MPVYSHGKDSPIKLTITRREARAYNRVVTDFINWQMYVLQYEGRPWTPEDAIVLKKATRRDMMIYNALGRVFTEKAQSFGRAIYPDDLPSDYLIKN